MAAIKATTINIAAGDDIDAAKPAQEGLQQAAAAKAHVSKDHSPRPVLLNAPHATPCAPFPARAQQLDPRRPAVWSTTPRGRAARCMSYAGSGTRIVCRIVVRPQEKNELIEKFNGV